MSIIKILGLGIMMRGFIMYKYEKHLAFPVNIKKKDLRMAKYIIAGLGGYAGELAAALRYFSPSESSILHISPQQRSAMQDLTARFTLPDIAFA